MAHENRADPLALICVDHDESAVGLACPDNDMTSAAGDSRASAFIDLRDERDVALEIDVEEEGHLLLREALLWREKASLNRLCAGPSDRREHLGPVIGTKGADVDRTAVANVFDDRIIGGLQACKMIPGLSNRRLLCRHGSFSREDDPSVLMLDLGQAQPSAGADRLGRESEGMTCA